MEKVWLFLLTYTQAMFTWFPEEEPARVFENPAILIFPKYSACAITNPIKTCELFSSKFPVWLSRNVYKNAHLLNPSACQVAGWKGSAAVIPTRDPVSTFRPSVSVKTPTTQVWNCQSGLIAIKLHLHWLNISFVSYNECNIHRIPLEFRLNLKWFCEVFDTWLCTEILE